MVLLEWPQEDADILILILRSLLPYNLIREAPNGKTVLLIVVVRRDDVRAAHGQGVGAAGVRRVLGGRPIVAAAALTVEAIAPVA